MIVFLILVGSGFAAFRQFVVVPRQVAANRILTEPVQRQSLAIAISANGTVEAERSINVSPKSAGVLKRLLVKEGDVLQQGQIIAYMDDSNLRGQWVQYQAQLAQQEAALQKAINGNRTQDIGKARAQLAEAQASLQELINGNRAEDITQAQARLNNAQASLQRAEADFQRNDSLYKEGAISRSDLDQKRADRDKAQADVWERQQALTLQKTGARPEEIAQARARVQQRQEDLSLLEAGSRPEEIAQNRAQVEAAKGSLQTIQAQIEDTILRAPFNGVVTKKYADPGAFVTPTTAGSTVSGAASNSVIALNSFNQVVANLAETNIAQIRLGQQVNITADAYPGKRFTGRVKQIAAQATVQQNVTSFEVKVDLSPDAQKILRAGMNVEATFQVGQISNAMVVPTVAVVREQGKTGVFVAAPNGDPTFVSIATGANVNGKTEVTSGLKGSERVLLSFPPGKRPQTKEGVPGGA
ncbi:MAG: efflux RND transporter periplasmic adaptor subunit [Thermosynechococcaceae cyanobacterium]